MISQKEIPIRKACTSLNISKSAYYNSLKKQSIAVRDKAIKMAIYEISLEYPRYGYRRIKAELRRKGQIINHKKVIRIMREENLLCKPKKFRRTTTDTNHNYPLYPNLAKDIVPTGINQLWVSDITYVHLLHECAYFAVLIDVFSRKCLGWELGRRIDTKLVLNALDMALRKRMILGITGLIHHSDQGVQYACNDIC